MGRFKQLTYLMYRAVLRPVLAVVVVLGTLVTIVSLAMWHWEIAILFALPIALLVACMLPHK